MLFILITFLFPDLTVKAQGSNDTMNTLRQGALKVFIDCHHCDMDFIRQQIPYVNYVRDVREADVYILETSQSTGSGGRQYTFSFQGAQRFQGINDTLTYNSRPDETRDKTREDRTKMIKMGLMRYVARTPLFTEVEINSKKGLETQEVKDIWNNWVFELQSEPQLDNEESLKELSWDNSASAYKITPDWKIEFEFDQRFSKRKYIYEDTTYASDRSYWSFDNLVVKSLTDHWSAGLHYEMNSSSYHNIRFGFNVAPAIEYDIFPYSESTRRQMRILYGIGYKYNHYQDTTIYNKIVENLFEQQFRLAFRVQQKWGYVNISLLAATYIPDFSKNQLELDGSARIRLFKGFSLRLSGRVARINNQLSLVKGGMNEADVLLKIHELATAYRVRGSVGIVYTFGSIYNNIVNPRFGD